jgi:DNA-directed RNA polymerase specialized sigma24 family protein
MSHRKPQDELFAGAFARLVCIALGWTKNTADAEDLAQQALADVFAGPSGAPPTDLKELVRRAASTMKGHFLNRRRAQKRREAPRWLHAAAEQSRGMRRTPEDLVAARERKTRLLELLLRQFKDDPLVCDLVEATFNGFDTPADQAEALGKDIKEIRKARKRLARAIDAIRADQGGAELARDWEADEGASQAEDVWDEALEAGEEAKD